MALIGVILLFGVGVYAWSVSPSRAMAVCQKAGYQKLLCYTNAIDETLRARGLPAAFDLLATIYTADPSFAGTCHASTHTLGQAAYDEFHATGHVELTDKTSFCGYGFYHGFMEELLSQTNNLEEARAFCRFAATQVPNPPGYAEGACYHGIGHGVVDGTDPSLWGDAQKLAAPGLLLCSQVASSSVEWRRRCDSGVFNSVALLYRDPKYHLDAEGNPFLLCQVGAFDSIEKDACFDQMNTLAVFMAHYDFQKAIDVTTTIEDVHYREVAIQGVSDFMVQALKYENKHITAKDASDVCGALGGDYGQTCLWGLLGGIIEFGVPGLEYQEAQSLCSSTELSPSLHAACYAYLMQQIAPRYPHAVQTELCNATPAQYKTSSCTTP